MSHKSKEKYINKEFKILGVPHIIKDVSGSKKYRIKNIDTGEIDSMEASEVHNHL
jgi:hypothetical protein